MWNEIKDTKDICNFMNRFYDLHDSCIKEIKYISGAYVNENMSMHPINSSRTLRLLIQRQFADAPIIELEFQRVRFLKLFPADDDYTCEILDSTLLAKDGWIYWCDCGALTEHDVDAYAGTAICAQTLRWRILNGPTGPEEFYSAPG